MSVIRIDKNRKIVFEDLFVTLYRDDALSIENKTHRLDYSFISDIKFVPKKQKWFRSIIYVILSLLFLSAFGNPDLIETKRITILFTNKESRVIDLDDIDEKLIKEILIEFRKRLKSKIAAQNV